MKNEILVWDGRESGEWEVEIVLNDDGDTETVGVFATEEEALSKVDELCDQNPDFFFDEEAHEMVKEENAAAKQQAEFTTEKINGSELFETTLEWYGKNGIYGDFFKPSLTKDEITKAIDCYANIWLPKYDPQEYSFLRKDLGYSSSFQREQIRDMLFLLRGSESTEYFNTTDANVKEFLVVVSDLNKPVMGLKEAVEMVNKMNDKSSGPKIG